MNKIKKRIKYSLLKYITSKFSKDKLHEYILDEDEKQAIKTSKSGYLVEIGWWNSWIKKKPIDINGNPLPWVTYSFIDFIDERLNKEMSIFEFGSGNSSFYYSSKVEFVDTVEHDEEWYNKLQLILPSNVNLIFKKLEYGGDYSKSALISKNKYDIIIIDGRDRVNSLLNSVPALSESGVLILDDSEREQYKFGIDKILKEGFKKLDFWGIAPGVIYGNKCTSIYYKSKNILNI